MLDKTSSIICAFGLAVAAPRSPYRHLELCGIAQSKNTKQGGNHMKIAVAGTGYVGLSISCLIAQHHTVCAVDLIKSKHRCTRGTNEIK
jgi:hypothetical protein